jgi:GNAT superfamily N-acetyltransferase
VVSAAVTIRELASAERDWAATIYRAIDFVPTPAGDLALVAEDAAGRRVGLGRLVGLGDAPGGCGPVELGGIWTDEAARGHGVAAAMVTALLARAGDRDVWCVPFVHLVDYYARFRLLPAPPPWPPAVAAKVDDCVARRLPAVAVLRFSRILARP